MLHYKAMISYMMSLCNCKIVSDIIYDGIFCLSLYDIVRKLWYQIWYHSFFSSSWCHRFWSISRLSYAVLVWFCLRYPIHLIWIWLWLCHTKTPLILQKNAPDVSIIWYQSPLISWFSWYLSPHHGTFTAEWCWLPHNLPVQSPRARCSTSGSSGLAISNVLETGVVLNGDCLDPAHGLVAVAAVRIVVLPIDTCRKKLARRGRCRGLCRPCRHSPDVQMPLDLAPRAISTWKL